MKYLMEKQENTFLPKLINKKNNLKNKLVSNNGTGIYKRGGFQIRKPVKITRKEIIYAGL